MKNLWSKLGKRERMFIAGGVGLLGLIALVQFALVPFFEEKKRVTSALDRQEKILKEMIAFSKEYESLKEDTEVMKGALQRRPPDFTLMSFLERKSREAGVRQNIKSMNTTKGMSAGAYEETLVDIRLEKLTLRQLVEFLYHADSPEDAVGVKKITVNKSKESPEYLTAQVQMVTYQPASAAARPARGP
jgi:type II secretory pathway component PulM